jgi:PAS domain S-box-containing protein
MSLKNTNHNKNSNQGWALPVQLRLWLLTLLTLLITFSLIFFLLQLKGSFESANQSIIQHNLSTSQLNEIKTYVYELKNTIHQIKPGISTNQLENYQEQIKSLYSKLDKTWLQFQNFIDTPKEKDYNQRFNRQLNLIKQNITTWIDTVEKIKIKDYNHANTFFNGLVVTPLSDLVLIIDEIINYELEFGENKAKEESQFFQDKIYYYIIITLIGWAIILLVSLTTSFRITNALKAVRSLISDLEKGDTRKRDVPYVKDEFGEITQGIQKIARQLHEWSSFAMAIGEGNFKAKLELLSEQDELGSSLINMQNRLKQVAEEDNKRNWLIQGEAIFSEYIRQSQSTEELAELIISHLPRYLDAHQGAFFIYNEETSEIFLSSSYAYSEVQKNRKFKLGEGFIGQSIKTKDFIFIKDVPDNYIMLTSGLGEAKPKALMVIPLIYNEQVHGAIELATLNAFDDRHIQFAKRLSEIIGAALANLKSKAKTLQLLKESQLLSEELQRKQKELIEKNQLMQQTQEKLILSQQELSAQIAALNNSAIVSEALPNGTITFVNRQFLEVYGFRKDELLGNTYQILNANFHSKAFFKDLWDTILQGNVWKGQIKNQAKNNTYCWVETVITPVKDSQGNLVKFITVQFDITQQKLQEEQIRLALEESMAQEEELRQNAEELEAQQEEMKRTQIELTGQINALNNAGIVSEADLQGRIINVNETFLKITKYSREQIIGQNHRLLKSGHQPDDIFEELWKTITTGKVWKGELKNRAKDGSYYWITLTITPVLGIDYKPIKYIGVAFDITAQKHQEEQIRTALEISKAQEAELRQTTNELLEAQEEMRKTQVELRGQIGALNNAAIVAETDLRGNITTLNEQFVRLSKYSREELLGQNHRMLKSGQHHESFYAELWKIISEGRVWHGEFCNKAKDGQFYWVKSTITPVLGFDGKPIKYIGVSFDITPQKRQSERIKQALEIAQAQEEELRKNAQKMLETQIELRGQINAINNSAIVSETDLQGNILTVNDEFIIVSKYSREELIGNNLRILKSDYHTDDFFIRMWNTISEGKVWSGEICNKAKDGTEFWVATTITPVLGTEGKPVKYICVQFDITKIKTQEKQLREALAIAQKQEEEIRKKQEQMDSIFSNVPGIIYRRLNDENWTITLINNHVFEVTGFAAIELLYNRRKSFIKLIYEEDLADVKNYIEKSLEDRQPYSIDYRIITKDKKIRWVRDKGKGLYDDNGNLLYVDGTILDITIQKQLDESLKNALEQSQLQQKLLEENAAILRKTQVELEGQIAAVNNAALVSETDLEGNILFVNEEGLRTWEYTAEEVIGKKHNIIKSDEHPQSVFQELWQTILSGKVWKGELKNLSKTGSEFWVHITITPVLDENHKPIKFIAVAFDITKQKRQALRIKQVLEESQKNEEELRKYSKTLEEVQAQMLETQIELSGQINALNNSALVSETNIEGNITYVNEEALSIWGYNLDEVKGKKHNILKSERHNSEFFKELNETIYAGKVWKGEICNLNKNKKEFWVHLTITPVIGHNNKPYKFIGVAFDITAQKVQSFRIREALKKAEEAENIYKNQIAELLNQQHHQANGVDTFPEFISAFKANNESNIEWISESLLNTLQLERNQVIDQPFAVLIQNHLNEELVTEMLNALNENGTWNFYFQQNENIFELSIFLNPDKENFSYWGVCQDITYWISQIEELKIQKQSLEDNLNSVLFSLQEFKNLRYELQQKEQIFKNLWYFAEIDKNGFINYANENVCKLLHLEEQNYFHMKWDIIIPRLNKDWLQEVQKHLMEHHSWQGEVFLQDKNFVVFIEPIKNLENLIVKYIVIAYQK